MSDDETRVGSMWLVFPLLHPSIGTMVIPAPMLMLEEILLPAYGETYEDNDTTIEYQLKYTCLLW